MSSACTGCTVTRTAGSNDAQRIQNLIRPDSRPNKLHSRLAVGFIRRRVHRSTAGRGHKPQLLSLRFIRRHLKRRILLNPPSAPCNIGSRPRSQGRGAGVQRVFENSPDRGCVGSALECTHSRSRTDVPRWRTLIQCGKRSRSTLVRNCTALSAPRDAQAGQAHSLCFQVISRHSSAPDPRKQKPSQMLGRGG